MRTSAKRKKRFSCLMEKGWRRLTACCLTFVCHTGHPAYFRAAFIKALSSVSLFSIVFHACPPPPDQNVSHLRACCFVICGSSLGALARNATQLPVLSCARTSARIRLQATPDLRATERRLQCARDVALDVIGLAPTEQRWVGSVERGEAQAWSSPNC